MQTTQTLNSVTFITVYLIRQYLLAFLVISWYISIISAQSLSCPLAFRSKQPPRPTTAGSILDSKQIGNNIVYKLRNGSLKVQSTKPRQIFSYFIPITLECCLSSTFSIAILTNFNFFREFLEEPDVYRWTRRPLARNVPWVLNNLDLVNRGFYKFSPQYYWNYFNDFSVT